MIDIYDSETLVNVYRMLKKKCDAIDGYINKHAYYFGPCTLEYGAIDVFNSIVDLMARKNQLINLKLIIDNAVDKLDDNDRKILYLKTRYSLSMADLCSVLELKERTAFRRIERAFANLADCLNKSKYCDKLDKIMHNEIWISAIREEVRDRRMSYKAKPVVSSL